MFPFMQKTPLSMLPSEDETLFEYWASFSPMAPMFGLKWRVAEMMMAGAKIDGVKTSARRAAPSAAKPVKPAAKPAPKAASAEAATPAPKVVPAEPVAAVAEEILAPAPKAAPKPAPEPVAKAAAVPAAVPEAAPAVTAKPVEKAAAAPAKPAPKTTPDDLSLIKGIGPKMVEKLAAAGINSFSQIAAWSPSDIEKWDVKLGGLPGRILRDDWVGQAKGLVG